MAEDWIKLHSSLMQGKWLGVPSAFKWRLVELAKLCKPGDGQCELPPARGQSGCAISRCCDMLPGNRREAREAVEYLSSDGIPGDQERPPTIQFETPDGRQVNPKQTESGPLFVVFPRYSRHQSVGKSAERMRKHRAKVKASQEDSQKSDASRDATDKSRVEKSREDKSTPLPPKAKRKAQMPEGWEPAESQRKLAQELGLDVSSEAADFRDWTGAGGYLYADWHKAFASHLRRRAKDNGTAPKRTFATELERLRHELAEARKTAERTNRGDHWQHVQSLEYACSHERERIQTTRKRQTPDLFAVAGKA